MRRFGIIESLGDAKYTKIVTRGQVIKKIYEWSVSKGETAESAPTPPTDVGSNP